MPLQNPANDDIAAYVLELGGKEIDKFMGMTGFTRDNPSELMETFPGTVVGTETNSLTNKAMFSVSVHSQSSSRQFLEKLVRTGAFVTCRIYVPTDKRANMKGDQIVELSVERVLVSGGGTPMGGKNNGPVTWTISGMNSKTVTKDGAIDEDNLLDAGLTIENGVVVE